MKKPADSQFGARYFVGYDLGTGGLKTVLINSQGQLLGAEFSSYVSRSRMPGWHEQDPNDWWRAIVKTTRKVLRTSRIAPSQVQGVSFGVQAYVTVPVDRAGRALRPCMTGMDSRAVLQAERINQAIGATLSSKDFPSKVLWLKENEPKTFQRAYKILDVGGYLVKRFTGEFAWSTENARWCGYDSDRNECRYEDFGTSAEKLAEPVSPAEVVGTVTEQAARQLGLRSGIPVLPGGSDVAAAFVGSGALRPGRAHIVLGTTTWASLSSEKAIGTAEAITAYTFAIRFLDRWIICGNSENGCACLNWFIDTLARDVSEKAKHSRLSAHEILDHIAESVEAGSRNLIFVPWMRGERAPVMDDCARGAFIGLTLSHGRDHFVRAIMEGVAYNMRWVLEKIESETGVEVQSLRALGGGFKSRIWTQIFADVMDREVESVMWPQYAGAIGAALIAALGTGVYKSLDDLDGLLPAAFSSRPRMEHRNTYERLLQDFKQTYPEQIAGIYRRWGRSDTNRKLECSRLVLNAQAAKILRD